MPKDFNYYEPRPKHSGANNWVAPEHMQVAKSMTRINGELQIKRHEIFKYSEENPPAWLAGRTRRMR